MSIPATRNKLLDVAATSTTIATAPHAMPEDLHDEDLPIALCYVGAGSWNEHAVGLYRQERTYILRVLVRPTLQPLSYDDALVECMPILNDVGKVILRNQTLDNTVDGVLQPITDNGVRSDLPWHDGTTYVGFEMQIKVIEKST